ncbi:MAG: hypothetical protein JWQ61_317 [Collimonas fungivorans]|nr:hypothetical protein [Collimonas fungivorans]
MHSIGWPHQRCLCCFSEHFYTIFYAETTP